MKIPGVVARHRALVAVAAVVVGIALVVVLVIRAGTSDEADGPPRTATTKPGGAAAELVRLVELGRSANVDVTYVGTTSAGAASLPLTTHLWRRSPLVRLDIETGSGDAIVRSSQMVTPEGPFSCSQERAGPWSCVPKPDMEIADVGVVSPQIVATLSVLDVSVRDDRVRGTDVRCFTVARPAATSATTVAGTVVSGEICMTSDGIAVRVEAGPARFEAVSLNREAPPDSVFRLPTSP